MPYVQAGDILCDNGLIGHCGIALRQVADGPVGDAHFASHAMGGMGVHVSTWPYRGPVFRPINITEGRLAEIHRLARMLREATQYGIGRAIFKSWSGSSTYSASARDRLQKYRDRMAAFPALGEHQGRLVVKNVYCSEYVVLLFQLAAPDEDDPYFIELNAKHVLPKTLERWLRARPVLWLHVGNTTGEAEPAGDNRFRLPYLARD